MLGADAMGGLAGVLIALATLVSAVATLIGTVRIHKQVKTSNGTTLGTIAEQVKATTANTNDEMHRAVGEPPAR